MSEASDATPEELLGEVHWVRGLARSLAVDASSADDLEQETWLAALRHGPARLIAPRAWLGRILANVARQDHRRSSMRVEREQEAARPEALPSAARLAERAELQRALVSAVLALEEPFRSTILWRFFQDLSSEEIAKRLAVPPSTVRNRLRRALELLRIDLEQHDASNWQDRCLALATLAPGVPGEIGVVSSWIKGAIVMGSKLKLGLGAAGVLAVSALVWNETRGPGPTEAATAAAGAASSVAVETTDQARPNETTKSASEPASPRVSRQQSAASSAATSLIFGDVHAPEGANLLEGRIELLDEWGERAEVSIARNAYAISGLHAGEWKLSVRDCTGLFSPAKTLSLLPGASLRADIELQPCQVIAIRLKTPSGESLEVAFPKDDAWLGFYTPRVEVIATGELPPSDLSAAEISRLNYGIYTPARAEGLRGRPVVPPGFSGVLELGDPRAGFASAMLRGHVLASAPIDADTRELDLVVDANRMLAGTGSLRLRLVLASSGELIDRWGIRLREAPTADLANPVMYPHKDGVFERPRLPAGTYELQIRAPGYEHTAMSVTIEPGRTTDLGDIRLAEGGLVRGRVVDESGRGVSALLCWSSLEPTDDPSFHEDSRSDSDGRFGLAELPAKGVLFRVTDPQWALDPVPVPFRTGANQLTLTVRPGTAVTLRHRLEGDVRISVRRPDGTQVWSASGFGPSTHRMRLIPGAYSLEAVSEVGQTRSKNFEVASEPALVEL
ncbi:MAG: sigma-70 family RNA polymerase sigma factor [Planctomycetota bacterium]